jgi:type VI secretion system secreted protein VgrG
MGFAALFDALFYGNAQRNRLIKLDTPLGDDWLVPLHAKGTSRLGRNIWGEVVPAVELAGAGVAG